MKVLVTMGFNNGVMVENLHYWYNINPGWTPKKGLPYSVRAIVSIAAGNLYFFRDDTVTPKTFLCFSKCDVLHKALKDKKIRQYSTWAWGLCLRNKWFIHVTNDRYTFGENTNIELISTDKDKNVSD